MNHELFRTKKSDPIIMNTNSSNENAQTSDTIESGEFLVECPSQQEQEEVLKLWPGGSEQGRADFDMIQEQELPNKVFAGPCLTSDQIDECVRFAKQGIPCILTESERQAWNQLCLKMDL